MSPDQTRTASRCLLWSGNVNIFGFSGALLTNQESCIVEIAKWQGKRLIIYVYLLHNDYGAWSAFQQDRAFDTDAFLRAVDLVGEHADWIVLPDIVLGGQRSLDLSLSWLDKLKGIPTRLLIAVQNGMQPDDVRRYLNPMVGLFVGGDTAWKESTCETWGSLARRRNCYLHVGRVNSQRRIGICAAAGADSFDGTSVTRYAVTMRPLDAARRQSDLFPASQIWTDI